MPQPAWLGVDSPSGDVALSTRARLMRNVRGHRFPHVATVAERVKVLKHVLAAARRTQLGLDVHKDLTNAEREYLVGARLVSPGFQWLDAGCAVLTNEDRSLSVMVNEEDHLRMQGLTAGWSLGSAEAVANRAEESLGKELEYAHHPSFGYLASSPFNAGDGRRYSCMMHLPGLATAKRLQDVLRALASRGLVARGLFGEASRAVGAFLQVSSVKGPRAEFVGACDYIIAEERDARRLLVRDALRERSLRAGDFATVSRSLSLADVLRVLSWLRWAACEEVVTGIGARQVDAFLSSMDLHGDVGAGETARFRAHALRQFLDMARWPAV